MPTTHLWTVTNQGKVYTLSTTGQQWEELPYCGMDFKRVSAVGWCIWAIGGDHQMYVYVFATDIPIRYKEVTYENQRWNPKEGFCSRLLPTDRPAWSSKDGATARSRERIKLPTLSWQWESDWQVEHSYNGPASIDPEGWTYAIDFPAHYTRDKSWLSYVRRRKWIRVRRYASMNSWANVPCIHDDPVAEPFIDVSIGGQDLPGGSLDSLAVWTVTVLGRIMFRKGVTTSCPEGTEWIHMSTPQGWEVNQLSLGSTGMVWAVAWNGCALVRVGISRNALEGSHWSCVEPPHESSKLLQVSVGTNAVWAITRDNKVWFRKGVKGSEITMSSASVTGSGWVEMVGEMCLVSVGLGDQVWSLGADEHKILYMRTGVTPTELSGKTWKPILLQRSTRINSSISSSSSCSEESISLSSKSAIRASKGDVLAARIIDESTQLEALQESDIMDIPGETECAEEKCDLETSAEDVSRIPVRKGSVGSLSEGVSSAKGTNVTASEICRHGSTTSLVSSQSPVRSRGPSLSSLVSNSGWLSGDDTGYFDDVCLESSWSWISGSGCLVNEHDLPNWFSPGLFGHQAIVNEPWRKEILDLLASRRLREVENFSTYEQAVDKSSWVITVKGQVLLEGRQSLCDDCKLELEKTREDDGFESATLRCFPLGINHSSKDKFVLDMNLITCTVCLGDNQRLAMAVYTPSRTLDRWPLRVSLSSDSELGDWLSLLSNTCCLLRGIRGAPSPKAIWSLTKRGDIFVHEPLRSSGPSNNLHELFWRQFGGHLRVVESCSTGVVWGIGYNHTAWVYTGGWGGGFFRGMDSSSFGLNPMQDVRCMYVYENQRWNPLTGFSVRRLPTDRCTWSDKTGRHECTKENIKLPSHHWQWTTEWLVDFDAPGGVDKDGWQYAKDFPMEYHSNKGLTDYVRRRRWARKCKLSTLGPWEELDAIRLCDVSLQVDHPGCPLTPIRVWAVSVKGEVLCRIGVTKACPKGICWEHVTLDQPAQSVSVGGGGEVWVTCKNGNAFLRHGVTDGVPTGSVWFMVGPPEKGTLLRHISAGVNTVWAVDATNRLWFRKEIMPIFPEGTSWKYVCGNIRCVSVGLHDEVWAVADIANSSSGVVCRRVGITQENKIGTDWEYGIGGNWHYVSVRGYSPDAE